MDGPSRLHSRGSPFDSNNANQKSAILCLLHCVLGAPLFLLIDLSTSSVIDCGSCEEIYPITV